MYNGEERRKTMGNEINDLKVTLASFTAKVTEWMDTTVQYRKDLCIKQDRILKKQDTFDEKLTALPCKERGEMYKNIGKMTKVVWGAIGVVFGILAAHIGWR